MSSHDNTAVARALNDAYNARDWDSAVANMAPDAELTNVATGQVFNGPDGARLFLQGWATAFPDSQVETTAVFADDENAAIEFVGRGTHSGPLASPAGDIPPTGQRVDVRFAQVLRFHNGKITSARLYFDLAGMLQQLGLGSVA